MAGPIDGATGAQNIQQLRSQLSERAEQRRAETRDAPDIQAEDLSERQAEEAAQSLARQVSEDQDATLSNGQLVDQFS